LHWLTKFLVVICSALSILLAGLAVAYAANADSVRSALSAQVLARQSAEARLVSASSQHAEALSTREEAVANLRREAEGLRGQLVSREENIGALRARLASLELEVQGNENRSAQLGATIDTMTDLVSNYRDEISRLRSDMVDLNRREIQYIDRIRDLEGQLEVAIVTSRALQEELASMQASGTGIGGTPSDPSRPFEFSGQLIRCAVTRVDTDAAGRTLVTIDEGANRGVQRNMTMNIVRDGKFLATIQIERADPQQAVGYVTLTASGAGAIRVGDVVLSSLR